MVISYSGIITIIPIISHSCDKLFPSLCSGTETSRKLLSIKKVKNIVYLCSVMIYY